MFWISFVSSINIVGIGLASFDWFVNYVLFLYYIYTVYNWIYLKLARITYYWRRITCSVIKQVRNTFLYEPNITINAKSTSRLTPEKYKAKEFINFSRKEDLELDNEDFGIVCKQRVNGCDFFKTNIEKNFLAGESCEKVANTSPRSVNKTSWAVLLVSQFEGSVSEIWNLTIRTPFQQNREIQDSNKHFEHFVENNSFKIKHYGSKLVMDSVKSMLMNTFWYIYISYFTRPLFIVRNMLKK